MSDAKYKDDILRFLIGTQSPTTVEGVTQISDAIGLDEKQTDQFCRLIKDDGYIAYTPGSPCGACKILPKGREFIRQGGYEHMENIRALKNEKANSKEDLEIQQLRSVIVTNNSVVQTNTAITDNIPIQNRHTRASVLISLVSLAFIFVTAVNDCNSDSTKELKEIKIQLEKQTQVSQSLKESLEKIGSSLPKKGIDSTKK